MKQQELEMTKYKIDTDNQTRITVAEIDVYKLQQTLDQNNNGIPDPMEIADMGIKRTQMEAGIMDKEMQASQKEREASMKMDVEHKKLKNQVDIENKKVSLEKDKMALEEKRMKHEKDLQVIKDKAAMAREQIKAKTALKNKVVGQK
jgi:hypothetical protein